MSNDSIVSCLEYISDDLIEEAMFSKGKTRFRFSKRALGIAACVSVVLALSVFALTISHYGRHVADLEQLTPMTLNEIEKSVFSSYIPDLTENGYSLDSAGVYNQVVFKASFFSDSSEVSIFIERYSSELHDKRIVDIESINAIHTPSENDDPIFLDDQFGLECMKYVTEQRTATNRIITQFSVISNGYVVRYVIRSTSQEEIAWAIERICLCYK